MKTFLLNYPSHYLGGMCLVKAESKEQAIQYGNFLLKEDKIGDGTEEKITDAVAFNGKYMEVWNGDY